MTDIAPPVSLPAVRPDTDRAALFDRYFKDFHALTYKRALWHLRGDTDAAEEVAQDALGDVYLKYLAPGATFPAEASIEQLLRAAVRNAVTDAKRKQWTRDKNLPEHGRMLDENPPDWTRADWHVTRWEKDLAYAMALNGLPTRRRQAFLMVKGDGRSIQSVAQELGLTYSGVRSLVQRAMDDLRAALGPNASMSTGRRTRRIP